MKKVLITLACMLAVLMLFAGCVSQTAETAETAETGKYADSVKADSNKPYILTLQNIHLESVVSDPPEDVKIFLRVIYVKSYEDYYVVASDPYYPGERYDYQVIPGMFWVEAVAYDPSDISYEMPLYYFLEMVHVFKYNWTTIDVTLHPMTAAMFKPTITRDPLNGYGTTYLVTYSQSLENVQKSTKTTFYPGDSVLMTLSGIAGTDYTGEIKGTLGINEDGTLTMLAGSTDQCSVKKGELITMKFPLVFQDTAEGGVELNHVDFFTDKENPGTYLVIENPVITLEPAEVENYGITFHVGEYERTFWVFANEDFVLPESADCFELLPYILSITELNGWYDNPEFAGHPFTVVSAEQNNRDRDFYASFNPKFHRYGDECVLELNWKMLPGLELPKASETFRFFITATLSHDFTGTIHTELRGATSMMNWSEYETYVDTVNGNLQMYVELRIPKNGNYEDREQATLYLEYIDETNAEPLILRDFKLTPVVW